MGFEAEVSRPSSLPKKLENGLVAKEQQCNRSVKIATKNLDKSIQKVGASTFNFI